MFAKALDEKEEVAAVTFVGKFGTSHTIYVTFTVNI